MKAKTNPVLKPTMPPKGYRTENQGFKSSRMSDNALLREWFDPLDDAEDAIIAMTLNDLVCFWNKGAERIYGWKDDEAIGRNAAVLLPTDPVKYREAKAGCLENGQWNGTMDIVRLLRAPLEIKSRWTLLRDAQNAPAIIFLVDTDVTERRQTNEVLVMLASRLQEWLLERSL
jgi:two-component system, cell cycle sensor histidine kinase and response regulator CckA